MPKFFQHINPDSPQFESITTLKYIDDSDPDLTLYVFNDGTKCNKAFIADINDKTGFRRHVVMAEIINEHNKWTFKKTEVKRRTQTAKDANGNIVEIPDAYIEEGMPEKVNWEAYPPQDTLTKVEGTEKYKLSYIQQHGELTEGPAVTDTTEEIPIVKTAKLIREEVSPDPSNITVSTSSEPVIKHEEELCKNLDLNRYKETYGYINLVSNGRYKTVKVDELERLVFDNNSKAAAKQVDTGDLISSCKSNERGLVDNMIKMSKKVEGEIEIGVVLNLPAKDVFKLLTAVYPDKMADEFIVNIANSISVHDLRVAVASGLETYYDNDTEVDEEVYTDTPAKEEEPYKKGSEEPTVNVYSYKAEPVEGEIYHQSKTRVSEETTTKEEPIKKRKSRQKSYK